MFGQLSLYTQITLPMAQGEGQL